MKNLYFLTDEILSLLELKEDRLFDKIPKEKISYYINESNKIGRDTSIKYKNEDIEKLLKDNGVKVLIKDHCQSKNLDIRGEIIFDEKERQIIIYKNSIEQIVETLKGYGLNISKKEVYNIHLAHELYHFLEFKNEENTNYLLEKIDINFGRLIKRKSTILKTREIAAHAFCKELLNLKFHPKLLDYIYLIENKKIDLKEFKSYIDNLALEYIH
jgi:hypothetical protein